LVRLSWYAPVINMAGRQRMLSQKLTKAALAYEATNDVVERRLRGVELQHTLTQWSNAHSALRNGDRALAIPKIDSAAIEAEWTRLTPHFTAMCAAAAQIVGGQHDISREDLKGPTNEIVGHEAAFLDSMERVVALMEQEAAGAVHRLRICAATIAAGIVTLLLALGWFVIRPAKSTIRRQVQDLESTVAMRTQELSLALEALRHEIAEREQSEARTQRLAVQLAHAGRVWSMGHFAAGLAHELSQPLTTIANYTEACDVEIGRLDDSVPGERLRKYVGGAKHAALRAGEIIRRMRNFVRPTAPTAVEVEINQLIREVLELCRTEAERAEVAVSLHLTRRQATVAVDPIQIQQVIVNLIQNALQALIKCPPDQRRINIESTVSASIIQVEVADSGPGINASGADAIFEPFYTTKDDGLGLGLSICRTIIEQHSGSIWAVADSSAGTRIIFSLPLSENNVRPRPTRAECVCR
jgi:C4-dicarboxylate-specific signal transduction histidine kinase